jgi:hypothetical protein
VDSGPGWRRGGQGVTGDMIAWLWTMARRRRAAGGLAAAGVLGLTGVAWWMSGPAGGPVSGAGRTAVRSCGVTRTGANVSVTIEVSKGRAACATVLRVEQGYAALIGKGAIRGNGGGAPVTVDGWTCQGYPTPEVLRTGDASECHNASAEVVAVLVRPASSN